MDKALALGDIAVGLPYIKKKSVELLKVNYTTGLEAAAKLPAALASFYQQNYPDLYAARPQDIHQAGQTVLAIYNRNVFPDLKVTWGTYPNNLGHTDFPGCFRCHDGSHTTGDGKAITQDCNTCHEPLATEEASPEILKTRESPIGSQECRSNDLVGCNKYEGLQINVISAGSMNRNVVVSLALMLLVASFASWVADDGAVLGEKSA